MITVTVAKAIWVSCVAAWYVIRFPHERRNRKKNQITVTRKDRFELTLLTVSLSGLGIIPFVYVFTDLFRFANYPIQPVMTVIGSAVFAFALYLFYRTHRELGRNWSVSLELHEKHKLITGGVYARVRHPMYSAFFLWAVAQAFLLPNFAAGLSGLIGFGTLFFFRVPREERMMLESFGDEYRAYMARTARIVPGIY